MNENWIPARSSRSSFLKESRWHWQKGPFVPPLCRAVNIVKGLSAVNGDKFTSMLADSRPSSSLCEYELYADGDKDDFYRQKAWIFEFYPVSKINRKSFRLAVCKLKDLPAPLLGCYYNSWNSSLSNWLPIPCRKFVEPYCRCSSRKGFFTRMCKFSNRVFRDRYLSTKTLMESGTWLGFAKEIFNSTTHRDERSAGAFRLLEQQLTVWKIFKSCNASRT